MIAPRFLHGWFKLFNGTWVLQSPLQTEFHNSLPGPTRFMAAILKVFEKLWKKIAFISLAFASFKTCK